MCQLHREHRYSTTVLGMTTDMVSLGRAGSVLGVTTDMLISLERAWCALGTNVIYDRGEHDLFWARSKCVGPSGYARV